ncbi:MerR family transcriptional regulator [Paenibacillus spongiae]|uniref:MerR family transcriptional regulator n=1 Tax=Paenibacillus spongiae TaxID=2909671 RepID=A0ABY5S4Q4_9BACL|nr:MerR family transcriptional regulator [Paenibacillus spongiae]UVI27820.1 MerR family transcriptional regulator [Paenibacillus spongiae]
MRMHIHEAAKLLGTTPRAIRFYEEKGLLAPVKSPENGYRSYEDTDINRLRWIVSLRELGLPITAIREAIASKEAAASPDDQHLLLSKLDESRQAIYREWSNLSQALQALDSVMRAGFHRGGLTLDDIEAAASHVREASAVRDSWHARIDYDGLAAQYREEAVLQSLAPHIDIRQYELAHRQVEQWLEPAEAEHGVDLGAGTGVLAERLTRDGAMMTAVEQSPAMLAILRKQHPDVEAKLGNLLALPFQQPSFHFAVSTFTLHTLDQREQLLALAEMDRILLPGGRICLAGLSDPASAAIAAIPEEASPDRLSTKNISRLAAELERRGYDTFISEPSSSIWILFAKQQIG